MTTTAAAIRDAMLALVEALTPTLAAETRFDRHREAMDFRQWAEENPSACFRRFSIRYQGNAAPTPVGNTQVEETSHTFEVTIAYPNSAHLGHPQLLELDDVIDSDQTKVHATIGPPGYASLTAPATVLHEENWSREIAGPVLFATIRYRVDFYRATGAASAICQVIGDGGQLYKTGDTITGESALRALYLTNGIAKLTYQTPSVPNTETFAHYLYVQDRDGTMTQVVSSQYGDWSYYTIGAVVPFDSATVIEASDDAVEVAFIRDPYDISSYSGGGIPYRDETSQGVNYPQSSATAKRISSIKLVKTVRMQRGEAGYYVGWHSSPRVGPPDSLIPSANNETAYGERELGTGSGTAVAFSSGGVTSRHPAWGSDANWAAAEAAVGPISNRVAWCGIDDADYSIWANATVQATQAAGFPNEQSTGPFWVGDIPNTGAIPFCRYIVLRERLETGVWQFGAGQSGVVVVHHVNEFHTAAGVPFRHQIFIGATPYVADSSSSYANEPSASIQTTIATLAAGLDWPVH